jgi:hypothetical protein
VSLKALVGGGRGESGVGHRVAQCLAVGGEGEGGQGRLHDVLLVGVRIWRWWAAVSARGGDPLDLRGEVTIDDSLRPGL